MKKEFLKISIVLLALAVTACLDDKDAPLDPSNSTNVVEFKNPELFTSKSGTKYGLYSYAFEPEIQEQTYQVVISYSGADVASKNIEVQLSTAPIALDEYNDEAETSYILMPDALYDFPTTVTIPKGKRTVTVPMTLQTGDFDLSQNYVLPMTITSTSKGEISGNFGTILLALAVKNKYDGLYEVTKGVMVDTTNAGLGHGNIFRNNNGYGNQQYELRTIGSSTNEIYDHDFFGGYYQPISSGASYSQYGNFSGVFTFDPATDRISAVTNHYGQPNPTNTRGGLVDATHQNKWTEGVGIKDVRYYMTQPSVIGTPPHIRTRFSEEWKYLGPR
jgi:hypothetical protein